jgi:predicted GNAT family acetyltransferase
MTLVRCATAAEFRARAEAFLTQHEAENNLPFGLLTSIEEGNYQEWYLAFHQTADGMIDGTATLTPSYNVVMGYPCSQAAIGAFVDDLQARYPDLHGVNGDKPLAARFAEEWTARTGKRHRLDMAMRIYKLEAVQPVVGVSGEMRCVTEKERDLLFDWVLAFQEEAIHERDEARVRRIVNNFFTSPSRFMAVWWDGGKPVSLAGAGGPTPNGIRIGPVYTPPEYRGHGYASANTTALSQRMLDEGRTFCFLFTDLLNPTSNHIYQQIGYQPVNDVDTYVFEG